MIPSRCACIQSKVRLLEYHRQARLKRRKAETNAVSRASRRFAPLLRKPSAVVSVYSLEVMS